MIKTTSDIGISLISSFEDLKLVSYLCPANVWTIGFGTTVYPNGVKVKKGDVCALEQAKAFFTYYVLKRFEAAVNSAVKVSLTQNQFDALVSLAYNIGSGNFTSSTLLKKFNTKNYQKAYNLFWHSIR